MSSYKPNIPQAGTRIDRTYQLITTNFTELNNQYGVNGDHVEFTEGTANLQGTHKQVTFSSAASTPFTAVTDHSFLYEQLTGAAPALSYLDYQASGTNEVTPLSPKVFCIFNSNLAVPPFMNVVRSFNVNGGTTSRSGSAFTIGFNKALPNANYLVYLTRGRAPGNTGVSAGTIYYDNKTTISIRVTVSPIDGNDEYILMIM